MYIFSERGDQELSKTISIMFIRHFWTILQYPEVPRVFSGIEYGKASDSGIIIEGIVKFSDGSVS